MKYLSLLLFSSIIFAQAPQRLIYVSTDPSGGCSDSTALQWNPISGNLSSCKDSIWGILASYGGGGGGTYTADGVTLQLIGSEFSANTAVTATRLNTSQGQDNTCIVTSGSSTAYVGAMAGNAWSSAYVDGMRVLLETDVSTSGGALTLDCGSGAKPVYQFNGTSNPTALQIPAGAQIWISYGGALNSGSGGWRLLSSAIAQVWCSVGIVVSTGTACGTSLTAPTGALVGVGQANTYTTGLQDFSSSTVKLPSAVAVGANAITFPGVASTLATLGANTFTTVQTVSGNSGNFPFICAINVNNSSGHQGYRWTFDSDRLTFQSASPSCGFVSNQVNIWNATGDVTLFNNPSSDSGWKLDISQSGSSGTVRAYDQTATTGLTQLRCRDGQGQGTTGCLQVTSNGGVNNILGYGSGQLHTNQDVFINSASYGVILTDQSSGCYRIISTAGVLSTASVTCPTF